MMHITYADRSVLVGDEAADTMMQYAALLARNNSADVVKLSAIGTDGDKVVASFLLDVGVNVMTETTRSTAPEPNNSEALTYMRERMTLLSSPRQVRSGDLSIAEYYENAYFG